MRLSFVVAAAMLTMASPSYAGHHAIPVIKPPIVIKAPVVRPPVARPPAPAAKPSHQQGGGGTSNVGGVATAAVFTFFAEKWLNMYAVCVEENHRNPKKRRECGYTERDRQGDVASIIPLPWIEQYRNRKTGKTAPRITTIGRAFVNAMWKGKRDKYVPWWNPPIRMDG